MSILSKINKPSDIKSLDIKSLTILAEEIRSEIIAATNLRGGHLASSLGAVEAIIALAYVFDFEKDKIIFDVGHQSYAYKMLTGRYESFKSLKTYGGISGFPLIFESRYDSFSSGHAGDALAASLGYAYARDKKGEDYFIISFIGDGAFCNGENLEALFNSSVKPAKFLTVLNDNGMSISENDSPIFKTSRKVVGGNIENANNASLTDGFNLDKFGLGYSKISDGHDIIRLVEVFQNFKDNPNPTLVHLKTVKGKGYPLAEEKSEFYHGVNKGFLVGRNDFSDCLGAILSKRIQNDKNIVAIVAGMSLGVGLDEVKRKHPENFKDVGIAEDYAVTFASSLALSGLKPIVCIYSTFLQRAYDQIVTNVCLQKLPVVFLIDHAGVVGDGYTHQGVFDIAYLSHIPNMTLLTPKNCTEMEEMIDYALNASTPVAIRYPVGKADDVKTVTPFVYEGKWEVLKEGTETCVLAAGSRAIALALKAAENENCEVVNARSIKPLDTEYLLSRLDRNFVTVEDGVKIGGFGSLVSTFLSDHGYKGNLKTFAFSDAFIPHGSVEELFALSNLTVDEIKKYL